MVKYLPDNSGARGFDPWVGKIPWREKWQPTTLFLTEKKKKMHKRSQKSQTQPSMDVQYTTRKGISLNM